MKNVKLLMKFRTKVVDCSEASDWAEARWEWVRMGRKQRRSEKCLCGRNILNVFFVTNRKTRMMVPMGRGCLNKLFKVEPVVNVL